MFVEWENEEVAEKEEVDRNLNVGEISCLKGDEQVFERVDVK